VNRRFGNIQSDDHYIIAAVLELRFKLKWSTSPSDVMMAKSRIVYHMESIPAAAAGAVVPSSVVSGPSEQLTDDLLSFLGNQDTALQDNSSCVGEITWLTVM